MGKNELMCDRVVIKGMIKVAHQKCAIWIKHQSVLFKTTVFTT